MNNQDVIQAITKMLKKTELRLSIETDLETVQILKEEIRFLKADIKRFEKGA